MAFPSLERTPPAVATWTVAELPWHDTLHVDAPERRDTGKPDPNPHRYRRWAEVFGDGAVGPAAAALGFGNTGFRELVENGADPRPGRPLSWVLRADRHLALGRSPSVPGEDHLLTDEDAGLLRPAADLVRGYQRSLAARVSAAVGWDPRLRDLPRILASACPRADLEHLMGRTMALETNVARISGRLRGSTPQERFGDYLRLLGQDGVQRDLWSEYTVLLRRIDQTLSGWLESRLEFAERIARDLPGLDSLHGSRLGPVTSVDFGAGDTHRGGRSVAVVGFSDTRFVYKPHSLSSDAAWNAVIDWFNAQEPEYVLRSPRTLSHPDHGWSEFVRHAPCSSDEGGAFYWRLGALLALNHALRGTDFHYENLIASGSHPVMVDMEALFHAVLPPDTADRHTDPAERAIGEGVVRVGLLPARIMIRDGSVVRAFDASGVGAEGEQESPVPVAVARNQGTDRVSFDTEHVTVRGGAAHLPHVDGSPLDPREHSEAFLAGFTSAYRIVADGREAWLAEGGLLDRFDGAETRFIARPTAFYSTLLSESTHPDFLRDGRDHDRFLARLAFGADGTRSWERLAAAELAELRAGDVPYFSCRPGSTDLTSGRGAVIPGFLAEPPVEAVRRRIRCLGARDLELQSVLIRRSFDSLQPTRGAAPAETLPLAVPKPRPGAAPEEEALEEALRIAHTLCDEAVEDGEDLGWIGLELVDERFWQLAAAPADLYSGIAGIGLFLSRTAEVTGDPRVRGFAERTARAVAERAAETVREHDRLRSWGIADRALAHTASPGALGPVGGIIHHLAHAGSAHSRSDWLDAAERCLPVLRDHVRHDTAHDLVSGSAGAILAALALHAVRPGSRALSVAEYAASALVERAEGQRDGIGWRGPGPGPVLSGMSHGVAGVAHALLRLHAIAPRDDYLDAAGRALAHEDTLFDPAEGNWRDLRPEGTGSSVLAWCHGAPGIGLARQAALDTPGTEILHPRLWEGMEAAERVTRATHFPEHGRFRSLGNSGLCHGDLGNLEFLLAAAVQRGDGDAADDVRRAVSALCRRGRERRWGTLPLAAEAVPGLMYGRAGIGYNLLRLALPDRVPSVLLLDAP